MRKIRIAERIFFGMIWFLSGVGAYILASFVMRTLLGQSLSFNLLGVVLTIVCFYSVVIIAYRTFLHFMPLPVGAIDLHSREEFIYHVYVLFFLFFFYPLILSNLVVVPLRRIMYRLLGAELGENTYPAGILYDPPLISIGKNAIIGADSKLIPHALEGEKLAHFAIKLGDNVTIGVNSTILAGSVIGSNAIVAAHSLVTKHTVIGPGEVWAGVPAKRIKSAAACEEK